MNKINVVLKLSRLSIPKKIEKARFIVTSMTGNTNFTTPSPTLATITTNANNLEAAHIAALGGGVDETANMHLKEQILDLSLRALSFYVETIANGNLQTAEVVALSSGMEIKSRGVRTAHEFAVEPTGNPGELKLTTKFSPRATFHWQMSVSPPNADGSAAWETIGQGTRSKLLKDGLTSGTRYYFRVSVIDKNGQGPWSNVLNSVAL